MHSFDRQIVEKVVSGAIDDGYFIDVHDGQKRIVVGSNKLDDVMRVLETTGTDYLILSKPGLVDGSKSYIRLVHGLAPGAIVDDFTKNLESIVSRARGPVESP